MSSSNVINLPPAKSMKRDEIIDKINKYGWDQEYKDRYGIDDTLKSLRDFITSKRQLNSRPISMPLPIPPAPAQDDNRNSDSNDDDKKITVKITRSKLKSNTHSPDKNDKKSASANGVDRESTHKTNDNDDVYIMNNAQQSNVTVTSNSSNMHMFKIQKIADPLFDQDTQPDLWISWKHKIEVCTNIYLYNNL